MSNNNAIIKGELTSILHSKVFFDILHEHKLSLQKDANKYIRQREWEKAYAAVAKFDDIDKIVELMQKKLESCTGS